MTTRSERAKNKRPKRDRGPQNPRFKHESITDLSWCRVVAGEFPCDREATCCTRRIKDGDFVVTAPAFDGGEVVGTAIMHVACMIDFMKEVPHPMQMVREEVAEIRRLHVPSLNLSN